MTEPTLPPQRFVVTFDGICDTAGRANSSKWWPAHEWVAAELNRLFALQEAVVKVFESHSRSADQAKALAKLCAELVRPDLVPWHEALGRTHVTGFQIHSLSTEDGGRYVVYCADEPKDGCVTLSIDEPVKVLPRVA